GDQGIFVRADVFEELGGFPQVKLMEDLLFVKNLRRRGTFAVLPQRIRTSARRWNHSGVIRQTLSNWAMLMLAHCGVSPNWLARFYPNVRASGE
ncbi:MAG: glycosyltransferase, partial [Planctomycetaceae bacterium]